MLIRISEAPHRVFTSYLIAVHRHHHMIINYLPRKSPLPALIANESVLLIFGALKSIRESLGTHAAAFVGNDAGAFASPFGTLFLRFMCMYPHPL
jgi:hypothetical protein